MEISSTIDSSLPNNLIEIPLSWDRKLAWWVSAIVSPTLVSLLGLLFTALAMKDRSAWRWIGIQISINWIIPILFILWMLKKGIISDYDATQRTQRFWPYLLMIACSAVTSSILWFKGAPALLTRLSAAGTLMLMLMFLINLKWKISGHAASAASFSMIMFFLFSGYGALTFALVPLVAWSRVRLCRHTLNQTIAGAALGSAIFGTTLFLLI